jgi:hypothetical protein
MYTSSTRFVYHHVGVLILLVDAHGHNVNMNNTYATSPDTTMHPFVSYDDVIRDLKIECHFLWQTQREK